MDIELGQAVFDQNGEHIADVDRLIVDQEAMVVREFLIREGTFLSTDRVVDVDLVSRIDENGIHLTISADQADSLPPFVEDHYITPTEHELNEMPQVWIGAAGGAGGGPLIWGPAGPGRAEPGQGSMFEPATVPSAPEETESAVDDSAAVIDEGTDVIDKEGEHVGDIEEVHYGHDGRISEFRVKSGLIFTKRLSIPLKWVDSIQNDAVRLSITAKEAEDAGKVES